MCIYKKKNLKLSHNYYKDRQISTFYPELLIVDLFLSYTQIYFFTGKSTGNGVPTRQHELEVTSYVVVWVLYIMYTTCSFLLQ